MKLPVIGTFNTTDSINVDSQRTVNWYLEKTPVGRNKAALYPTPGSILETTAGTGPIRGSIEFNDLLYVVSGQDFYEINTSGTATNKGTLNSSSGRVSMDASPDELLIADGTNGYIWDKTTLTVIADAEYPDSADQVVSVDGYFIVNDPDKDQGLNIDGSFFWSDLRDGTSWTGTSFATAERDPDKLIAIAKSHREVWMFGETSTEIWELRDGLFLPISTGFSEWGIAARDSVSRVDQTMVWLSKNEYGQGTVVQATGFVPKVISSPALNSTIAGYSKIDDAFSFTMQWKGHTWYVLTFPAVSATWVFDINEGVWFEWNSWQLGRSRYNTHTFFNNRHYMGDYTTGSVYYLDADTKQENGNIVERLRRTSHFYSDKASLFFNLVELEFEYGVGGASDAQVMLRWSDDYGHTWSNEYWKPLGKIGEYKKRLRWKRGGQSRDRVYEIRITDSCLPTLIAGHIQAKESSRET